MEKAMFGKSGRKKMYKRVDDRDFEEFEDEDLGEKDEMQQIS